MKPNNPTSPEQPLHWRVQRKLDKKRLAGGIWRIQVALSQLDLDVTNYLQHDRNNGAVSSEDKFGGLLGYIERTREIVQAEVESYREYMGLEYGEQKHSAHAKALSDLRNIEGWVIEYFNIPDEQKAQASQPAYIHGTLEDLRKFLNIKRTQKKLEDLVEEEDKDEES